MTSFCVVRGPRVGWIWSPNKFPNVRHSKSLGPPTAYYYCSCAPPFTSQRRSLSTCKSAGRFWRSYNRIPLLNGFSIKAACRIGAYTPAALRRPLTIRWQNFSVFQPRWLLPTHGSKSSLTLRIRRGCWMPSSAPCTADQGGALIASPVFRTVQYKRVDQYLVQFIAGMRFPLH